MTEEGINLRDIGGGEPKPSDWKPPVTTADFHELRDIAPIIHADQKAFVCNYCKNWNMIKEADIIDLMKPRKIPKKDVHMKLDSDIALIIAKFSKNFGGYTPMMVYFMNEFVKRKTL